MATMLMVFDLTAWIKWNEIYFIVNNIVNEPKWGRQLTTAAASQISNKIKRKKKLNWWKREWEREIEQTFG